MILMGSWDWDLLSCDLHMCSPWSTEPTTLPSDVQEFSVQPQILFLIFTPGVSSQTFFSKLHEHPPGSEPSTQAHPRYHMSKHLKDINQAKNCYIPSVLSSFLDKYNFHNIKTEKCVQSYGLCQAKSWQNIKDKSLHMSVCMPWWADNV